MDINRDNIEALFKSFDATFKEAFSKAPDTWTKFAMPFKCGSAALGFPFLESLGKMREWLGERQIKNVSSKMISVIPRAFEQTVGIKRDDIEDDNYGVYTPIIGEMAFGSGKLWNDLAIAALLSNPVWIDGVNFFSATRTYGTNTILNAVSTALSAESYKAARAAMLAYKDHGGNKMGVNPNLLIVGPALEDVAYSIIKDKLLLKTVEGSKSTVAAAVGNPFSEQGADYIVVPEIEDSRWYLTTSSSFIKPVGVAQRKSPVLTRLDRDTDHEVFMKGDFLYGTDARGEGFLTFPHLLYRGGVAL